MEFTDEQYKTWARKAIESTASEALDWTGIGEQFEDDWEDLSEEEFDAARQRVYDLIRAAKLAVIFPGDPGEVERLAGILWDARKVTLGYDPTAPGLAAMPRDRRDQYEQFAAEVAKRLGQDGGRTDG